MLSAIYYPKAYTYRAYAVW